MNRTRWGSVLAALLVVVGLIAPVRAAEGDIQVFLNGSKLEVPTATVSGRTLVPLRAIFEALGAEVTWDQSTQTAKATWSGGELQLPIGSTTAVVNGSPRVLDVPAQLVNGSTMVPLRFVAETLGAQVGWYGQSRVITIIGPRGRRWRPRLPGWLTATRLRCSWLAVVLKRSV